MQIYVISIILFSSFVCHCQNISKASNITESVEKDKLSNEKILSKDAQATTATTNGTNVKADTLRVKVLLEDPFVMKDSYDPTKFVGMFIDILHLVSVRSNLDYVIDPTPEHAYGYEYQPGVWTGLVGAVNEGTADVAVAPLTITSSRYNVVDFTQPIMIVGLRILYKKPKEEHDMNSSTVLLSPFSPGLWFLLILLFIAVSTVLYIIGRFSPYEDPAFVGKAATFEGLTLLNSFLYSFSSITFQGYTAAPKSVSGRTLASFWWIFALIVITSYTASLCSVLLAFKPDISSVPFTSFSELSSQDEVAYGIMDGGSTDFYLQRMKDPISKRLYSTINANEKVSKVSDVREGVARVRSSAGEFAFIMEGPMAEYLSGQSPCDLMVLGEELGEHAYAFACRKGTGVCQSLNSAILQLKEEGLLYDIKQKWSNRGCATYDPSEYIFYGLAYFDHFGGDEPHYADRTLNITRFGSGFLLIIIGIVISCCILLGEIFYAKRRGTAVPRRLTRNGDDQEHIRQEYRDEVA